MRELEARQKFKRRLYSMPALAVLLVLSVMLVRGAYSMLITERQSAKEADLLALEVAALREREGVLSYAIDRLSTEEGIEEEIKSKYNVARQGEYVAVIVDKPQKEALPEAPAKPWWSRVWSAIIGR
jgi:cell division protein FtsB